MLVFLVLLFLPRPAGGDPSPITCYNDGGQAVDWFYLYKLPKRSGSNDTANGLRYLLMEKGSEGWAEGKADANSTEGAPGRTVGQLYGMVCYSGPSGKSSCETVWKRAGTLTVQNQEVAYILYNDQRPRPNPPKLGAPGNLVGHTKGIVLLDKNQGFWLVHSTPHFPPRRAAGRYSYVRTGMREGQSFLCVTYPLERFQTIGEQLLINQPSVYDCDVPLSLATAVPALAALCKNGTAANHVFPHVKHATNRSVTLTSAGGTNFLSFAKGASFKNDLYTSWVAPTLQSHLLVQFWRCSRGVLPSECTGPWKVLDIMLLHPGQSFEFNSSHDHSKWAVSTRAARSGWGSTSRDGEGGGGGWVCVGDINRNEAEESRGGGTVCQQNPAVWKAYRSAALNCADCSNGTSCEV